jgi:hypothetical protein
VTTLTLGYGPKMRSATASVRIQRPRAIVHARLGDVARRPEFVDHFLADWTVTHPGDATGAGARVRLRAKGGGADDELELEIVEVTPSRIAETARGGKGGQRLWRLSYDLEELSGGATQVHFCVELQQCSTLDRLSWPLMRSHLERQYGQALLRLKRLLESERPRG